MPVKSADTHISTNGAPEEKSEELDLPDVPDVDNLGTRLVRRVVGLTFSIIGGLLFIALLIGVFVRIDTTIDAQGQLEPVSQEEIRTQESASVVDVLVSSGDTVSEGQTLIQLDTLQPKSELARLRSEYRTLVLEREHSEETTLLERREQSYSREQAESELLRAQANLREQLATYGYDPKADVDSVLSSYSRGTHIAIDRALAEVISAQARLQSTKTKGKRVELAELDRRQQTAELQSLSDQIRILEQRLDRRTITAPISGVVLTDRPEDLRGQFIQKGELLLEIARLEKWRADLFVTERSVSKISEGDRAKVEIQAFQDETKELVHGTVSSVAVEPIRAQGQSIRQPSAPSNSDRYRVTVRLDPEEVRTVSRGKLRQGYTLEGKVITDSGRILRLLWDYLFSSSSR
jgi:multidrug resistance efflux pump